MKFPHTRTEIACFHEVSDFARFARKITYLMKIHDISGNAGLGVARKVNARMLVRKLTLSNGA